MSDTYDVEAGQEDWSQFPTAEEWDAKYPQAQDEAPPAATATAAPAQDDWSKFPTAEEWDKKYPRAEAAEPPEAGGALGTFSREAAHAAVPAATGILTGAATGALTGAALGTMGAGPIGTAVGGFLGGALGMLGGSMAGEAAQDKTLKAAGYNDDPQRQANKEAHPVAAFMGGVAPFLGNPMLAAKEGAGLAAQFTGKNLAQRAMGSGMMTAFEGGQQLYNGEFHPGELAGNAAVGFAMPNGNRYTRAIHDAGAGAVDRFVPGRPDTAAPNAEADKAVVDTAQQAPNITAGDATAQQPAADPAGAIGYENSKAAGPQDATKKKSTIDEAFGDTGKKGFSQGDVTKDPTTMAAMGGAKATLAPEPEAPANVGRVVPTGIVEAAQAAKPQQETNITVNGQRAPELEARVQQAQQAAAPQVHPAVQAAMDANAKILRDYNGRKQPTEIKQEFERNRKIIFADRDPKKIVGSPDGTGEVPLGPKVTNTMPERPQATLAPEQAAKATPSSVQRETGKGYVAAADEADRRNGITPPTVESVRAAEGEYTPEMQAARLARIQERQKATLAPESGAPSTEVAPAPRAEAAVEPAAEAPIVAKPQKGLPNKRLAKEDDAMLAKLRSMGWDKAADMLEKTPEAERPALRAKYAAALPRERTKEKSDLENKLGKQANSPADRDRHNSAIDAIQKAFDEHAPKETETAAELSARLKAAVDTANTAHGTNPLHAKNGYRPQKLPNTFNWMRKVQDAALKRPEYWTQDKINEFKADENATREANAEYPTQDPKLLDASIEKSKRGGNVAEAVLEAKGSKSHEDAVLERTNLEKAGRAIKELDKYFNGKLDHSDLSAKARKTLDDMPKDVRKSGFEATEKDADPSHIAKVIDWLREYHGEPKKPFEAIDTHEQETGYVKPKERQITSRAELADVEKPATPLLKGVTEKPKAKEKKPKYDFEGKTVSGKELSPEEAARIIKASEEAQARNKSAAAPKPSFDKEGDKYSPLKVGIKDMLGHIVDAGKAFGADEGGGLHIGRIGDDFKNLFAKFAKMIPPRTSRLDENWEIKPEASPFAHPIKTEAQASGHNIAQMLNRAGKVDNVIKVHALAAKEQAHILAPTKEQQRQMYEALETRNPDLITDPKLRDIFEHSIVPAHIETAALRAWIKEHHPEVDIGRDTEDGLHRQSINGGNRELELESLGENADPTAGSSPISTTRRSPVMERQFAALEDADGNRHIVHLKIGETGKPTGEFSVWKGYKNHEMPENTPPLMFENVGDLYKIGDRTFKMKDATTEEIHKNALGTDNKPMEYQRDAAASVYTANAYFRQLANHLQVLDRIKASREMAKYATDQKAIADKHPDWKQSEVPGFQKYWMDDHIRESLEDAYQQGFTDSALNKARNFSRAITQSIFWTPTAHAMNVGVHWMVGRGFKWLPGNNNYRTLAETGAQAIKSVVTHNKIQDVLHEEGAGLIFAGTRSENATNRLAAAVGDVVKKNAGKWEQVADKMGVPIGDLVRGIYKASRTAMWSVNDMFLTQAILEHLKSSGKDVETASKDDIRESIAHIERHIPNYRTPSRIMTDSDIGRTIAKGMRDPLFFGFGRYRYGVFNSFAHMTKAVLHGTPAERAETAGQMMVMGALAFVVYPMIGKPIAQMLTGNDAAEVRGRGPVAPIGHIKDDLFGKGDAWPLIRETISVSPLASVAMELLRGKDFGGRDIVNKKDMHDALRGDPGSALRAGAQLGGWAAQSRFSPVSTLNSSLSNPKQGVLGGLVSAAADIKNPSDKSQKYDAQTEQRLMQETNRRRKTQPNIGDKVLGALGIN